MMNPRTCSTRAAIGVLVLLAGLTIAPVPCLAGGGPENVVVVVNPDSWASLTVANEFIRQRGIHPSHVIALDLTLARRDDTTDIDAFREKILQPILAALKARGLEACVDTIAYSADIPTAIDFSKDAGGRGGGAIGSINGLTFLQETALAKGQYWSLNANTYFRQYKPLPGEDPKNPMFDTQPSQALSVFAATDKPPKYLLSTVLGVTSNRGNSVMEAVACLKRAAAADGTNPKGAFYFMSDGSIRTETRKMWFKSAIAKLEAMGRRATLGTDRTPKDKDHGIAMPVNKDDILGAMLGQQFPSPARSGSKTLPGAIVENLTSEGGIMSWSGGQAPISTFIQFGAAGSSGTVTEPSAIWQKFPSPFLFVHYAAGCSLAEAFYQSVNGPFQLLIIGEPLCRPFAKIPAVTVEGLKPGEIVPLPWPKDKEVKIAVKGDKAETEFFLDGQPRKDMDNLAPGYHELLAVATAEDAIATQGWQLVPFIVKGAGQFTLAGGKAVTFGQPVKGQLSIPGSKFIEIWHCGRIVKTVVSDKGEFQIDSTLLGMGPVRLDAVGEIAGQKVVAEPLRFEIVAPKPLPAINVSVPDGEEFLDGPVLTAEGIEPLIVNDMRRRAALQEGHVQAGKAYKIEAYFDVAADEVCQFQVWTDGQVTLQIDGQALRTAKASADSKAAWTFLPVALAKGKHKMLAEGKAGAARELVIRYGPPGTRDIGKRCHTYDAEHVSLHFSHVGKPPTTEPATTQAAK